MKNTPWQRRMKAAGLSQVVLAKLLGVRKSTVSDQLKGVYGEEPVQYMTAAIVAWELMTHEQRREWVQSHS